MQVGKIKIKRNDRNFEYGIFNDRYDQSCSIQKSSLAFEDCIWLGLNGADPQILFKDAVRLGIREVIPGEKDTGWVKFDVPKEVTFSTSMHLTRKQVSELLPILQCFVETGELSNK